MTPTINDMALAFALFVKILITLVAVVISVEMEVHFKADTPITGAPILVISFLVLRPCSYLNPVTEVFERAV